MRHLLTGILILSLISVFTSCSNKQYQVLFDQRERLPAIAGDTSAAGAGYRIKAQDILQIRNLQNLSYIVDASTSINGSSAGGGTAAGSGQQYQVEADGNVALPVIGRIQVAGLNRAEARTKIERLYRDSLLRDPIIELRIINLKVTILGEIRSQGNYPLVKDRTTLVEMIGEAGGLTERADETRIEIIRGGKEEPRAINVNLKNMDEINDPSTILQNGDIIYIAQNKRAARLDNLSNFSTIVQPALILFNTILIIYTLAHH